MRNDDGVVEVSGQGELDGDRPATILAMLLAGDRERADVGEPAGVEIGHGGGEHGIAVEVEQAFMEGWPFPRDYDEGQRCLQRAAEWGSATAKAMLAERRAG